MANQDGNADPIEAGRGEAGRGETGRGETGRGEAGRVETDRLAMMDRGDRRGGDQDNWSDLLGRLPGVWAAPDAEMSQPPAEYGDRLLAAARAVSRGR